MISSAQQDFSTSLKWLLIVSVSVYLLQYLVKIFFGKKIDVFFYFFMILFIKLLNILKFIFVFYSLKNFKNHNFFEKIIYFNL